MKNLIILIIPLALALPLPPAAYGAQGGDGTAAFLLLGLAAAVDLLPAIIAYFRDHPQQNAITALNLFLGWTLLGWVLSLVWALTEVRKEQP